MNLFLPLLVGLLFLVGAFITRFSKDKEQLSNYSVALAFIVLIGLITLDLIPELKEIASENNNLVIIIAISIVGILVLKLLDKLIPSHHHDHHDNEKNLKEHNSHLYHIGFITLVSLLIHNIIEGMTIYIVSTDSLKTGMMMALGVGLHNIPLGIEISATMADNIKEKKNMIYLILLSLSSLIGGLIVLLFGQIKEVYLGYIIALTLGMCIYIALFELLHEIMVHIHKKATIMGLLCGLIIIGLMLLV